MLTVMLSVLDMSAEDRARIQEARRRHGLWGMVTTTLEGGGERRGEGRTWMPPEETPKDPRALADLWVDFLLTETESGARAPGRQGQSGPGAAVEEEKAVEGENDPQKPGGRLSL